MSPALRLNPKTENLDAAALWWAAAVVRDRCYVLDRVDVQAGGRQRADSGFATCARALHAYLNRFHAVLIARDSGSRHRRLLRGIRSALARALETRRTGRGPADHAAFGIGKRDDRIV